MPIVHTSKFAHLQRLYLIQHLLGTTSISTSRIHLDSPLVQDIIRLEIKAHKAKLTDDVAVFRTTITHLAAHPFPRLIQVAGPTSKLTSRTTVEITSNFASLWSSTMYLLEMVTPFTTPLPCQVGTSITSALGAHFLNLDGWVFETFCRTFKVTKTIQTVTVFWQSRPKQQRPPFFPLTFSIH